MRRKPETTASVPEPPDLRRQRRRYDSLRREIGAVRFRYVRFCWAALKRTRSVQKRTVAVLAMQEKMQARGLYAAMTAPYDIRWAILKRFWQIEKSQVHPSRMPEQWGWHRHVASLGFDVDAILYGPNSRRARTA